MEVDEQNVVVLVQEKSAHSLPQSEFSHGKRSNHE